jgi:hypothetical protein
MAEACGRCFASVETKEMSRHRSLPSFTGKRAMCEHCPETDIRIEGHRWMAKMITDEAALSAIDTINADLEAQKLALHPKPEAASVGSI